MSSLMRGGSTNNFSIHSYVGNPATVSIGKMLTLMGEQDNTIRVLSRILGRDYNKQHLHDVHNSLFGNIAIGPSSGREGILANF